MLFQFNLFYLYCTNYQFEFSVPLIRVPHRTETSLDTNISLLCKVASAPFVIHFYKYHFVLYLLAGLIFGRFFDNSAQLELAVFEFFGILPWVFFWIFLEFWVFSPKAPWVFSLRINFCIYPILQIGFLLKKNWQFAPLWSPVNFCTICSRYCVMS